MQTYDLDSVVDSIEEQEGDEVILGLVDTNDIAVEILDKSQVVDAEEETFVSPTAPVILQPVETKVNKAEVARNIFKEMWPKVLTKELARKDVIKRFIDEAGLTVAGAATYYQKETAKLKKAAEAVVVTLDSTDEEE